MQHDTIFHESPPCKNVNEEIIIKAMKNKTVYADLIADATAEHPLHQFIRAQAVIRRLTYAQNN